MATPRKPKHLHQKRGPKEKYSRDEVLGWESEYIQSCQQGMSDRVFLGKKGLHRDYFHHRKSKDIPELSNILEKGHAVREEFYTRIGIAGMTGKLKGFNLGGFVWLTKHMLGWWDQTSTDLDLSLGQGKSASQVVFKARLGGGNDSG